MKKISSYILSTLLFLPMLAAAQNPATLENLQQVGAGAGFKPNTDLKLTIASIIQALLGFLGIIFFILILWGGFQWMTSGGNEQKIDAAKKRITSAVIGLALVMMSYAIARTVNAWLGAAV